MPLCSAFAYVRYGDSLARASVLCLHASVLSCMLVRFAYMSRACELTGTACVQLRSNWRRSRSWSAS